MRPARLLERITRGDVANVAFSDLEKLVVALGFRRVGGRGSHHVYARPGVDELINLQHEKGNAKLYQVRQLVTLVDRYDLRLEDRR